MNRSVSESWSYEFTEHAPVTTGAEALRSRHEPKVGPPAASVGVASPMPRPPVPVADGEPTIREDSPLPPIERRTMERRLAERRARPATPAAKATVPVGGREPATAWRRHLVAVLAAFVLGFVAGVFLAQRQPSDAADGPALRLDTSIGTAWPSQESSRRLASPSATQ